MNAVAVNRLFLLLLAGTVVGLSFAARAEPAEVESLIAQGNELRQQGRSGQAVPLFQKAYDLAHTPRTEAQLGLAELAAGYPVEAECHLSAALEATDDRWIAKNRAGLAKVLADARNGIGDVSIEGDPVGARVKVNGRDVGVLPLSGPVRVAAGRVDVEMIAPGYASATSSVRLGGRERQTVHLRLKKLASDAPALSAVPNGVPRESDGTAPTVRDVKPGRVEASAKPTTLARSDASPSQLDRGELPPLVSTQSPRPTNGLRTAAWIMAAAAVLGAGTGLGLNLAAISKNAEFNKSCDLQGNNPVPKPNMPTVQTTDCVDLRDTWDTERRWSVVGYVAGGGLALLSGVFFVLSRSDSETVTAHAPVRCVPGVATISCGGVF